jgi:hypothetical protein
MSNAFGVWGIKSMNVLNKALLHALWSDEEDTGVAAGVFVCIWLASDRHGGWLGIPSYSFTR